MSDQSTATVMYGPLPEPDGATDFEVMSAVLDAELNQHFLTEAVQ